jgi:2-desacetyl-2-hydroxyethyl bacteriochlorophyllide A dehydrogenase
MKALVYTAPRKLEFKDWPDPEPGAGEALVRIRAAAVCGSDLHGWLGHSRGRVPPLVLGHEVAGEVVEVRDSKAGFKPGESVTVYPLIGCGTCMYCTSGRDYLCPRRKLLGMHVAGGFAEYLRVPVSNLEALPADLDFTRGALVEPLACGVHMARLAAEDRGPLAILGAGPIGLMALQAARQLGFLRIAVVEINARRAETARKLGADLAVNPKRHDHVAELQHFFGDEGCAVVFDAAGFSVTRQLALQLVRPAGLIVFAGLGEQETPLDCVEIIRREIRLTGAFAYNRREFQEAVSWVAGGRLTTTDWISEASLAEGQQVFEELASPNASRIKVVLKP